ncbi:apolipoprotein N-acyltransferase [Leucothrix sargassi]|nr:apolipoprotein N-acyltransferase [Leucothrix sargassi]
MQSVIKKRHYLMSLVAGACMVLSFAPLGFFPIAFLSPAVLFYLMLQTNQRKQLMGLGWAFGIGLFGMGASWVFQSMHSFAQAPVVLAGGLTFLFVLTLALLIAVVGLIASFFKRSLLIVKLLLVYPAAWVLVEWLRGWFLTGFPWLYAGHAQIDTWFAHYAPVGGILLVSWATVVISGALVMLVAGSNAERVYSSGIPGAHFMRVEEPLANQTRLIGFIAIAVLVAGSWGLSQMVWVKDSGNSLRASLVQANIAQDQKWLPEQRVPSVERYMQMTRENWESDLIVWPETAVPGILAQYTDLVISPMHSEALANNTRVVLGGFHQTDEGHVQNSAMVVGEPNNMTDIYAKRHLVPLGEYIPLLEYLQWLGRWMNIPFDNVSVGASSGLLSVGDYKAQMTICYEDAFGEEIIADLPEADFLINITNDGWFSGSFQPYQHMQIARFRALETGRYLLRATNTGVSGIVDHLGKITATVPAYTQDVVTGDVKVMSGATPYVKYGNYLIIVISALMLLLGFFIRKREHR